jgi:hypothetical protein
MHAKSLYIEVLGIHRRTFAENHPDNAATAEELAKLYQDWGKPRQTAEWRQSSVNSLEFPPTAPLVTERVIPGSRVFFIPGPREGHSSARAFRFRRTLYRWEGRLRWA